MSDDEERLSFVELMKGKKHKRGPSLLETLVSTPTPLLWFLLVAVLVLLSYPTVMGLVRKGGLSKAGFAGFSLEFTAVKLLDITKVSQDELEYLSEDERMRLLRRMEDAADNLGKTSILWVDAEAPFKFTNLRRVLLSMGITVDTARSSYDACRWMWDAQYDIVISDYRRKGDPDAACSLAGTAKSPACKLFQFIDDKNGDSRWPKLFVFETRLENVEKPVLADEMTSSSSDLLHSVLSAVEELPDEPDRSLEEGIHNDANQQFCDDLLPPKPPQPSIWLVHPDLIAATRSDLFAVVVRLFAFPPFL